VSGSHLALTSIQPASSGCPTHGEVFLEAEAYRLGSLAEDPLEDENYRLTTEYMKS
jgi:hypothetical protein